jgi:DNA-binding HxlR family transcriptional regulator
VSRAYSQPCPIARTLDIIGDRWTLLVVRDLFLGDTRFTEIRKRSPGMPTKMLSDRLKSLEQHAIIERTVYSEHPLRAEYHLTTLGRSLEPIVSAIFAWGMLHTLAPAERPAIERHVASRSAIASKMFAKVQR